jgi:peptidyl-prolyl cis-trans isomerase B (cyclophilin B)
MVTIPLCYPALSSCCPSRPLPDGVPDAASREVDPRRFALRKSLRILCALLVLCLALPLALAQDAPEKKTAPAEEKPADAGETIAILHTSMGDITLGFYPYKAPNHVDNFLDLSRTKFYDGTLFHRVISGFMLQGGDPLSKDDDPRNDGTGNGPRRIKAEFTSTPHSRGVVSMARSSHPDSASCQFFIVHQDSNFLDGKYSVFGYVIEGMDVVDKIAATPTNDRDRPATNVVIQSVEVTTR